MDNRTTVYELERTSLKNEVLASSPKLTLKEILNAIRAKHWIKNFFVLAPLLFSVHLLDANFLFRSLLAYLSFCLTASVTYLLNDIIDRKKDLSHPTKRLRPIASGTLSVRRAFFLISLFFTSGIGTAALLGGKFTLLVLAYALLSTLYSALLKRVVIIDVLALSFFYLLRVVAGAFAIEVRVSNWLLICTILLAVFIGFGKRRHELTLLKDNAKDHRKILSEYSPYFLDQMISVTASATLVAYALYTMSQETIEKFHTDALPLTIPFVLYGIFRYLYLVHQKEEGGDPTKMMLTDKPLLLTVGGWVAAVVAILYLK